MADGKTVGPRRRAVGTRDRIMSHLAAAGEVTDKTGMASTLLAREVGYTGTSIAFAQLLSGMERSGLIRREVRGKRTYRIAAVPGIRARLALAGQRKPGPRAAAAHFDYDQLARRLLVHVVRELAASRREHAQLAWPDDGGPGFQDNTPASPGQQSRDVPQLAGGTLERTVADLQRELARARELHRTLNSENARLREQLRIARESLARLNSHDDHRLMAGELDAEETSLLGHLLSPAAQSSDGDKPGTGWSGGGSGQMARGGAGARGAPGRTRPDS